MITSPFEKPKKLVKKIYQNARRTSEKFKQPETMETYENDKVKFRGKNKGRYFTSKAKN